MPIDPSKLSRLSRAKYRASNLFLRTVIGGIGFVPYRWRVPGMGWLVSTLAPLVGFDKRVRANLKLTCPELSDTEITRLCREVSNNAGRTLIELYAGKPFLERAYAATISGPGLKTLDAARAEGRPVILVTGHFGNYDAARSNLIGRGHKMGALYRRMANPYFNEHYVRSIERIGKPMFEQGRRGMMEMVRHLKAGGIIAIVADLHSHGGKNIDFFGKPAVTSIVPAELALKYKAAMIPIYATRQENGLDFEITVHEEIPHTDAVTMTQAVCTDLEALIRQNMGQWFWIHRRWKPFEPQERPKEDVSD
ncbi:lysophospholipid acyltransferase family protein [Parasedimentitalea maritima]|uniref:Lysophospholipid acyltransferase family protein n=1 Tax=Parasedimentitalea maritima TaxID=2578117 RepID=A0ABY2USZ8_9RHOB|nr:lysophospholipid acyltransferase family protein [Zongyanglinia marina]TLP60483.1 lysophospholipid acyltransferase family protein [Zongyanglinia marina]